MKKVSNKLYKARKIMDYTGVVFLVLLLLFIWQLYRGPVAVPFLKPYIIKALNHDDSEYQVTVDAVNLELVRSIQPIKIIANNVVYKKMTVLSSLMRPKLPFLSVSARCCAALLRRARSKSAPRRSTCLPLTASGRITGTRSTGRNLSIISTPLRILSNVSIRKTVLIRKAISTIFPSKMPNLSFMRSILAANGCFRI